MPRTLVWSRYVPTGVITLVGWWASLISLKDCTKLPHDINETARSSRISSRMSCLNNLVTNFDVPEEGRCSKRRKTCKLQLKVPTKALCWSQGTGRRNWICWQPLPGWFENLLQSTAKARWSWNYRKQRGRLIRLLAWCITFLLMWMTISSILSLLAKYKSFSCWQEMLFLLTTVDDNNHRKVTVVPGTTTPASRPAKT